MTTGLSDWERRQQTESRQLESPLLSIREAIGYLRVSQSFIYENLHRFEIVRLGRRVFLTRASADRLINANLRKPSQQPTPIRRRRAPAV
jgi:hypothetical protein